MLWLGLADIQSERDGEMWLDRWAIRKLFFSGRRQTLKTDMRCLWKLTKPESVLRSEGAEDQRLPEPQLTEPFTKFTNFFRLDTSCGMFDGAGEVLLWKHAFSCYRNTFIFFFTWRRTWTLKPLWIKVCCHLCTFLFKFSSWLCSVHTSTLCLHNNNSKTKPHLHKNFLL